MMTCCKRYLTVLKRETSLSLKTTRILVLRTLKIRLQNDGLVKVFKSSYTSWRPVFKTGLQDVFKIHFCPLVCCYIRGVLYNEITLGWRDVWLWMHLSKCQGFLAHLWRKAWIFYKNSSLEEQRKHTPQGFLRDISVNFLTQPRKSTTECINSMASGVMTRIYPKGLRELADIFNRILVVYVFFTPPVPDSWKNAHAFRLWLRKKQKTKTKTKQKQEQLFMHQNHACLHTRFSI